MTDLTQLTAKQLKQYLSEHRKDDARFSAALSELLGRDPNRTLYPAEMSLEEMERIVQARIEQVQRAEL